MPRGSEGAASGAACAGAGWDGGGAGEGGGGASVVGGGVSGGGETGSWAPTARASRASDRTASVRFTGGETSVHRSDRQGWCPEHDGAAQVATSSIAGPVIDL